ncbi:MAG: hypothetical protein ACI8W7_001440 [Gammaproteobacteria bacterium]|jgi:hypothetical protein
MSMMEQENRDLVLQLLDVASGGAQLCLGEAIIDRNVTMHMDGLTIRGGSRWRGFIRYLRHRQRSLCLTLKCGETLVANDRVTF